MKRGYLLVVLIACISYSCNDSRVVINGRIACHPGCKVYLDVITPGDQEVIDSIEIDSKGNFKFVVNSVDDDPTIYNLRLQKGGQIIPLILKKGDRVKVKSIGDITRNYIVEGSEESQLMQDISTFLSDGAQSLDSLANVYVNVEDALKRDTLRRAYINKYHAIKKEHIKFVVKNANSIVAIYALYQRLPSDETLFGNSDILYYKMVADSTKIRYPNSPYVTSLESVIAKYNEKIELLNLIQDEMNNPKDYPDIELPDMYGKMVKLSESDGKVILVEFWSATLPESKLINGELKKIYAEYATKGFEVYQVSVDSSKSLWINTIREQKIPWITVCDFEGESTSAALAYNITTLPSNYLIDQEGVIVAKNIFGEELEKKVAELLK